MNTIAIPMIRALISALAVLAALLLWQDARHSRQNAAHAANEVLAIAAQRDDAEARLRAANQNSIIERGVLLKRAATAEAQLADAQAQNKELAYALKASPVWADTPIPVGVLNALTRGEVGASVSPNPAAPTHPMRSPSAGGTD